MGLIFIIAIAAAISAYNFILGRRWSRLENNPWRGKRLGGFFSTPHPGTFPALMHPEEVRRYGRTMMIVAPGGFVVFATFVLFASRIISF